MIKILFRLLGGDKLTTWDLAKLINDSLYKYLQTTHQNPPETLALKDKSDFIPVYAVKLQLTQWSTTPKLEISATWNAGNQKKVIEEFLTSAFHLYLIM